MAEISESVVNVSGVFQDLINARSFVDKLVLSVWGIRRERVLAGVETGPSHAIGGPGRFYARSVPLAIPQVGNYGELRYGRLRPWKQVPPFRLVLRSVAFPLDNRQVELVLSALMRHGFRAKVSHLELTFDTQGVGIDYLDRHLFTRAKYFSGHGGTSTLYVGSPRSPWQTRIYQKTERVVRVEFVFRRAFLRRASIVTPADVENLRSFDLSRLVEVCDFNMPRWERALSVLPQGWRKQLLLDWPSSRQLQPLAETLRAEHGIDPAHVLQPSRADGLLSGMQERFYW